MCGGGGGGGGGGRGAEKRSREKQASCCTICKCELPTNTHLSSALSLANIFEMAVKLAQRDDIWALHKAKTAPPPKKKKTTHIWTALQYRRADGDSEIVFSLSGSKRDLAVNVAETGVTRTHRWSGAGSC